MQYKLSQLTKKLQKAIDSEDFELAKEINDEIKLINL
jgi:protein-arginine kinase activator protein McsA